MTSKYAIARCKTHHSARRIEATEIKYDRDYRGARSVRRLALSCGCAVTPKPVSGYRDETVACTARCRTATNFDCSCSCGGEDHGAEISDVVLLGLHQ